MKYIPIFFFGLLLLFTSCIGDDIIFDEVDEQVRITNPVDSLQLDSQYQFQAIFLNNVGIEAMKEIAWSSSNDTVLSVDASGLAQARQIGQASIFAKAMLEDTSPVTDSTQVVITEEMITNTGNEGQERSGTIRTTSSYLLEGSFVLRQEGDQVIIDISDDYRASSALPGLYVYLTNNPNTSSGALEIGMVTTFEGAHQYEITGIDILQYNFLLYYCKPFNVKVGDGEIEN